MDPKTVFARADIDSSGELSLDEWLRAFRDEVIDEDVLKRLFHEFDVDKDGSVTLDEFKQGLERGDAAKKVQQDLFADQIKDCSNNPAKSPNKPLRSDPEAEKTIKAIKPGYVKLYIADGEAETFYALPRGTATEDQVATSSAGIQSIFPRFPGWAAARVAAEMEKTIKAIKPGYVKLYIADGEAARKAFQVKKSAKLSSLFAKYCEKRKVDVLHVEFTFKSQVLNGSQTPDDIGLQDLNTIFCIPDTGASQMNQPAPVDAPEKGSVLFTFSPLSTKPPASGPAAPLFKFSGSGESLSLAAPQQATAGRGAAASQAAAGAPESAKEGDEALQAALKASAEAEPSKWSCAACTFLNPEPLVECAVCGGRERAAPLPGPPGGKHFSKVLYVVYLPSEYTWALTFENSPIPEMMILVAASGNSGAAPAPEEERRLFVFNPAPTPPPFSFGVSSAASGGEKKVPGKKVVKARRDGGGRGTSGPQAKIQTATDAATCITPALSSAAATSAERIPPGSRVQICNLPPQMKFFEGKSALVVSYDVDSSGIHARARTHTHTHISGILQAGLTSRNFFLLVFRGMFSNPWKPFSWGERVWFFFCLYFLKRNGVPRLPVSCTRHDRSPMGQVRLLQRVLL
jgi:hypothetical protein